MAYLMHFAVDNSCRFSRNVHYFQYNGVRFKLIQNPTPRSPHSPRKYADVLLTIVRDEESSKQTAYAAAGEFLSALSWYTGTSAALRPVGGAGVGDSFRLRQARCSIFTFPGIPYGGHISGHRISPIAAIETDDQRTALTLFREAGSSNKLLLSFLLNWQIMDVAANKPNPTGWINSVYHRQTFRRGIRPGCIQALPLQGRKLGDYLLDDCRHAIAHIRRLSGKKRLEFDVLAEDRRLVDSTETVRALAKFYITHELGLRKKCHLVRKRDRGFPTFVVETAVRDWVLPSPASRRRRR